MPKADQDRTTTVSARVTNRVAKVLDRWVEEGGHASRAALAGSLLTEIVQDTEESEK